ncbi:hypothetical protein B0A55_10446 [Friedmanniomyces simplex]|uniref:BTB domain-containing protein n=1 Tax=Friedmanniomyces simplex TaxID=329884 RepID=A0A4U0WKK4_9PEZI|nr:hypothetical protein B0A55_10446 [Friedmanniomyces simplex]
MPTPIKIEPATEAVSRKRPALEHGQVGIAKKRPKGNPSYNDVFTVLAEAREAPFIFHKDRLCQSSDFFVAACAREWRKETRLSSIDLSLVTPAPNDVADAEGAPYWRGQETGNLLQLYITGDMLLDERVKNLVIDELLVRTGQWPHGSLCLEPEHVRHVWEHSVAHSHIRTFLLTSFAATMNPQGIGLFEKEFYTRDFFYDLALRQMELRDSSPRTTSRMWLSDAVIIFPPHPANPRSTCIVLSRLLACWLA